MTRRRHRWVGGALAVALLLFAGRATSGADPLTGDNDLQVNDDWPLTGHLLCAPTGGCSGPVTEGGMVAAWQRALYANAYLSNCGSSGIDGIFGSRTASATSYWQADRGLVADGKVGPVTWGRADNNLVRQAGSPSTVMYVGDRTVYYFLPTTGGYYSNKTPSGTWLTGHPGHYSYPYC